MNHKMALFMEWSIVAEAVFSAMQYVVLLAVVVYFAPLLLLVGVMNFGSVLRAVEAVYVPIVMAGVVCAPIVLVVMVMRCLKWFWV